MQPVDDLVKAYTESFEAYHNAERALVEHLLRTSSEEMHSSPTAPQKRNDIGTERKKVLGGRSVPLVTSKNLRVNDEENIPKTSLRGSEFRHINDFIAVHVEIRIPSEADGIKAERMTDPSPISKARNRNIFGGLAALAMAGMSWAVAHWDSIASVVATIGRGLGLQ